MNCSQMKRDKKKYKKKLDFEFKFVNIPQFQILKKSVETAELISFTNNQKSNFKRSTIFK